MTDIQLKAIAELLRLLDASHAALEGGAFFTLDEDGDGTVFEVRYNQEGHYLVVGGQQ